MRDERDDQIIRLGEQKVPLQEIQRRVRRTLVHIQKVLADEGLYDPHRKRRKAKEQP